MKTVGIALIFGLCTWIGIRVAAKKTERLKTLRTIRTELRMFAERITSGSATLTDAAADQRILSELLSVYQDALSSGATEKSASETACSSCSIVCMVLMSCRPIRSKRKPSMWYSCAQ